MLSDPNSASNFNSFLTRHLHLNLDIDFSAQILGGFVDISLVRLEEGAGRVVLDAAKLNVKSVSCENVQIPVNSVCPGLRTVFNMNLFL